MNKILYVSVAVVAVLGSTAFASAQNQRVHGQNGYYSYGAAGPNEQTGPWSDPRATRQQQRLRSPFTWEEKRAFDYQQPRN
jgi:hypothetical protein